MSDTYWVIRDEDHYAAECGCGCSGLEWSADRKDAMCFVFLSSARKYLRKWCPRARVVKVTRKPKAKPAPRPAATDAEWLLPAVDDTGAVGGSSLAHLVLGGNRVAVCGLERETWSAPVESLADRFNCHSCELVAPALGVPVRERAPEVPLRWGIWCQCPSEGFWIGCAKPVPDLYFSREEAERAVVKWDEYQAILGGERATYAARPYPGPVTITEMPKLAALEAWLKALGRMAEAILCDDSSAAQFYLVRAMGR